MDKKKPPRNRPWRLTGGGWLTGKIGLVPWRARVFYPPTTARSSPKVSKLEEPGLARLRAKRAHGNPGVSRSDGYMA